MVSTRSELPALPPNTSSSTLLPTAGSSAGPSGASSSTAGPALAPQGPTQAIPSLDTILQHARSTATADSNQLASLKRLLDDVAAQNVGDVLLGSLLMDNLGHPTIDPLLTVLHPTRDTLAYIYIM